MKALKDLSVDQLKKRIEDLEYMLSGLAQMGGNVLPEDDVNELLALRVELKKRSQAPRPRR